jgi:hypothetical protein
MMTLSSVQVVARYFHFGTSIPLRVVAYIPMLFVVIVAELRRMRVRARRARTAGVVRSMVSATVSI